MNVSSGERVKARAEKEKFLKKGGLHANKTNNQVNRACLLCLLVSTGFFFQLDSIFFLIHPCGRHFASILSRR